MTPFTFPVRKPLAGIPVSVTDYDEAADCLIAAAKNGRPTLATALAVHGLMTAAQSNWFAHKLRAFDLVCPDGQPVRWGLNWMYKAGLTDRVYGPELMLRLCRAAVENHIPVFLYGSTPKVNQRLAEKLIERFDGLNIAGRLPSRFRQANDTEDAEDRAAIRRSGARIVFVGLGCPLQEEWAYAHRDLPLAHVCVGAAFDFHAGLKPRAPPLMQRAGLEWFFRLACEPRRLWRRYLIYNTAYLRALTTQWLGARRGVST